MQVVDANMFDNHLKQWLNGLPFTSIAARGRLPHPGEVFRRPGRVLIQRDEFHATSGTVSTTLDTVRLSIRSPPSLFATHQPVINLWFPINDWDHLSTWNVIDALQRAAHSLRRPYDPGETLFGQIFVQIFVNSQVQQLRCFMGAMPTAAWDLHATPVPPRAARSLRWSSYQDPSYVGPSGEVFHHRTPDTDRWVFTFEIKTPDWFEFKYAFDADGAHLNPNQLREFMMDMAYIK